MACIEDVQLLLAHNLVFLADNVSVSRNKGGCFHATTA